MWWRAHGTRKNLESELERIKKQLNQLLALTFNTLSAMNKRAFAGVRNGYAGPHKPSIKARFCTAAPEAPLPRLSNRATTTA